MLGWKQFCLMIVFVLLAGSLWAKCCTTRDLEKIPVLATPQSFHVACLTSGDLCCEEERQWLSNLRRETDPQKPKFLSRISNVHQLSAVYPLALNADPLPPSISSAPLFLRNSVLRI